MYDNLTRTNLEFAHNEAEKRIAQLEEELANADYQLEGRDLEIKELKEQIEKMKCCFNCYRFNGCSLQRPCRNYEDWKLKE